MALPPGGVGPGPAPGAPATPPTLPGSVAGSPPGPGATPVASPGAGAGNTAAANAIVKSVMPALHQALNAFPVGSKQYKAVIKAVTALSSEFGQAEGKNLVPAAISQMAGAAQRGGPVANAPAPGLAAAPPQGAA